MGIKDWFTRKTLLQLALDRGSQPGADLSDELRKLTDYSIKSRGDAEAVCAVLSRFALAGASCNREEVPAIRLVKRPLPSARFVAIERAARLS